MTSEPFPRDQWYKYWATSTILPYMGRIQIDLKILAVAFPFPGYVGFIRSDQKKPTKSFFDPKEYPYLLHTLTMDRDPMAKGDWNPRFNKLKTNNVFRIKIIIENGFVYKNGANEFVRHIKLKYKNHNNELFVKCF